MVIPMQRHVSCLAGHHGASWVHLHVVSLWTGCPLSTCGWSEYLELHPYCFGGRSAKSQVVFNGAC